MERCIDLTIVPRLEARGCAAIHVSSGGLHPAQSIPVGPNYQVPLARAVKQAVGIPVVAVGLITGFDQEDARLRLAVGEPVGRNGPGHKRG